MDADDRHQHCAGIVKSLNPDFYLATLLAPKQKRHGLMALHAFHSEVSRIPACVSKAPLGEIRLQWWLDTIDAIYAGEGVDHPVARQLATTIKTGDLPRHEFTGFIKAHMFELYSGQMATLDDLKDHLKRTTSAIFRLSGLIAAGYDALAIDDVLDNAGLAYGLTGILRFLKPHTDRAICYIPGDILTRCGVTTDDLMHGRNGRALELAFAKIIHLADHHLRLARREMARTPPESHCAFYPASLVPLYLKVLKNSSIHARRTIADVSQMRKQWEMFKRSLFEHF